MQLDKPLHSLQIIDIAAMRLDMVADLGRGYDAALQAITAERMLEQLVPPDPRPAPGTVPSVLLRRLTANTHAIAAVNAKLQSVHVGSMKAAVRRRILCLRAASCSSRFD